MKFVLRSATDPGYGKTNGEISIEPTGEKKWIRITANEDKKDMFLVSTCVNKKDLLRALEYFNAEEH